MKFMQECNFDSIVGLTHNYAGLSYGNVASAKHQNEISYPKQAALQGLEKMWQVAKLGIRQAVLPPLVRPHLGWLRSLGFCGDDPSIIQQAVESDPVVFAAACSASSMWAANAATVSPSIDCQDGRLHFSIANLNSSLHRSIESQSLERIFQQVFASSDFCVHPALPSATALTDEGAANHTRLCAKIGEPGLEVFVYGRDALDPGRAAPTKFPARQTLQACQAIARRHQLLAENTFYLQQNPAAIDAGVFHNDVIAVGNQDVLLVHQLAYVDQDRQLNKIADRFRSVTQQELQILIVSADDLTLEDAVSSYLFNSQLLTLPNGRMALVCPADCQANTAAQRVLESLLQGDNPIEQLHYVDLRQSMNNGGGPACLRLRVVLSQQQQNSVAGRVWLDRSLYEDLREWVERNYPDQLSVAQLASQDLLQRSRQANLALAKVLELELPVG